MEKKRKRRQPKLLRTVLTVGPALVREAEEILFRRKSHKALPPDSDVESREMVGWVPKEA